jgi:transposase
MDATIHGEGPSVLRVNRHGIDIHLSFQVFGKSWPDLMTRLVKAAGQRASIIFAPRVMTERSPGADAPRWKQSCVDVLSWMLFLLKVPLGHELVRLWRTIDWGAINRLASSEYHNAHGGRLAWAPAQLVAMLMLMFLYGVAYETRVVSLIQENIVWCWFCGFGLFGPFPKHDALYDFRERVGREMFEALLTLVVQACLAAGLVSNELVHFDLASVTASAHRWSPYERAVILSRALIRYLELVWTEQRPEQPFPEALRQLAVEVAVECLPHKSLKNVKPERIVVSVEQWEQQAEEANPVWQASSEAIVETLLAEARPMDLAAVMQQPVEKLRTWLKGIAKQVMERLPHARGDQGARVGRTTNYTWFCGYLLGFVVDGAHQIITAVIWAAGNIKQHKLFKPALKAHIQRAGKPKAAAGDSAFDQPEVHSCLDQETIIGHVTSRAHTPPRDGGYGTDRVTWVDGLPSPLCPGGQPLQAKSQGRDGQQVFEGTACSDCGLYARCYPSGEGRAKQFRLHPHNHRRWQQNRAHCQTEEYKAAQRERFTTEGRFGLAKTNHHGARAPYRSDEMNHLAGLMIAIVMNLRILARHRHQNRQTV